MAITKIMERASAIKVIEKIKDLICDVDLEELCGESVDINESAAKKESMEILIRAVMCGLVYWDDDKNCMVQKFIRPLKSGAQTADYIEYRNKLTLENARDFNAINQIELTINALAAVSGRSIQLIGKLSGQDLSIATACISFFDK